MLIARADKRLLLVLILLILLQMTQIRLNLLQMIPILLNLLQVMQILLHGRGASRGASGRGQILLPPRSTTPCVPPSKLVILLLLLPLPRGLRQRKAPGTQLLSRLEALRGGGPRVRAANATAHALRREPRALPVPLALALRLLRLPLLLYGLHDRRHCPHPSCQLLLRLPLQISPRRV